ncbi:uncharacterized protein [Chelonus insularis]|uniref:uncharacterized protein n=1 Tax=Chelonus insularis TaxID=460826 RepID=UPI00158A2C11|nr:uncharacterized protein LOC118069861 [Chelonus insularis]
MDIDESKTTDLAIESLIKPILSKIPNLVRKLRLRQVSKRWGDLIEEVFEEENLWKVLCTNDYIYPWVYNIIEVIFQDTIRNWSSELLSIAWKRIYLFYNYWSLKIMSTNIHFELMNFEEYAPFEGNVQSVDIHADKIAINIKKTKIIIFEVKNVSQESSIIPIKLSHLPSNIRLQRRKITRIKLWFTATKKWILIVHTFKKPSKSRRMIYIDLNTRKKLYNPFKNQRNIHNFTCASHRLFIATSELVYECKYTESNRLVLGNHIFEFRDIFNRTEIEQLNVLEMSAKSTFKEVMVSLLIKTAAENVRVINLKISNDNDGIFKRIGCDRDIRIRVTESLFYMPMPGIVFITSASEMIINLWYNLTETHKSMEDESERIVQLEAPSVFDVSRENEFRSSIKSDADLLRSPLRMLGLDPMKITSMFFFCNVLFLGTESGAIHMYIADSIKSFIRKDFFILPTRKLQVSKYPIININVIGQYGTLLIIATTPKLIHISHLRND